MPNFKYILESGSRASKLVPSSSSKSPAPTPKPEFKRSRILQFMLIFIIILETILTVSAETVKNYRPSENEKGELNSALNTSNFTTTSTPPSTPTLTSTSTPTSTLTSTPASTPTSTPTYTPVAATTTESQTPGYSPTPYIPPKDPTLLGIFLFIIVIVVGFIGTMIYSLVLRCRTNRMKKLRDELREEEEARKLIDREYIVYEVNGTE